MKFLIGVVLSAMCVMCPTTSFANDNSGGSWTEIQGFDDWPIFNMLAEGKMWCPGSELVWLNPLTPDCGKGKRFHIRNAEMYSCITTMDMDYVVDPRLSGVMWFNINGNLNNAFSGPVYGKWMSVPSETCDPADLTDPAVYWQGTWQGKRTRICDPTCWWIGNLKIIGRGFGGDLEGLEFRGEEAITTFTPLPAPWEHIPGFPFSGPEGVIHGFIGRSAD